MENCIYTLQQKRQDIQELLIILYQKSQNRGSRASRSFEYLQHQFPPLSQPNRILDKKKRLPKDNLICFIKAGNFVLSLGLHDSQTMLLAGSFSYYFWTCIRLSNLSSVLAFQITILQYILKICKFQILQQSRMTYFNWHAMREELVKEYPKARWVWFIAVNKTT